MPNTYSENLVKFVEDQEGFRARAYWDVDAYRCGFGTGGKDVNKNTVWTREYATQRLREFLNSVQDKLNKVIVHVLPQNQFDMILSCGYNCSAKFLKSTLIKMVNAGNIPGAADQFLLWVHSNGKVDPDLVKRRAAEQEIFLYGYGGKPKTSTEEPKQSPTEVVQIPTGITGGKMNPVKRVQAAKTGTKTLLAVVSVLTMALQNPTVHSFVAGIVTSHPTAASIIGGLAALLALLHDPNQKGGNA